MSIHVACCFDENMRIGAEVLLASIVTHARPQRDIVFHAFTDSGTAERFCAVAESFSPKLTLRIHTPPSTAQIAQRLHVKEAVLASLSIANDLVDVERVIILDADTLVLRSLDELFDLDLKGNVIAASIDYTLEYFLAFNNYKLSHSQGRQPAADYFKTIKEKLGGGDYLNSGVMVVDTAKWRSERLTERCFSYLLERKPCAFNDQDALNNVVLGRFLPIDPRWNALALCCRDGADLNAPSAEWQKIRRDWRTDPWIVHYAGPYKPWRPRDRANDHKRQFFDIAARYPTVTASLQRTMASQPNGGWTQSVLGWSGWMTPVRLAKDLTSRTRGPRHD